MAYQEGLERNEALLPFRELVFFPCMMYSWQIRGQRCPSCGIEQQLIFQALVPKSIFITANPTCANLQLYIFPKFQ
jgi:hypothetical protein